jgi:tetratricopeptide (TPR) repeat protein
MATTDSQPKRVFISYSHKDEDWKERLHTQLKVLELENQLTVWEDRQIAAGDNWNPSIEQAIHSAQVAVLLISADFLVSSFIRGEEVPRLLERRTKDGLRVIPLILKPCPWQAVPWLSAIQGRPKDNKPLSGFNEHEQDQCLSDLVMEILELTRKTAQACHKAQNASDGVANPVTPSHPVTPIPPNNLPYHSLGSLFKGRDGFLETLHDQFQREPKRKQAIVPWQAIHGLGGIGKSRAAVEYAWRYADEYQALLFLKADNPFMLVGSLAGLCPLLGIDLDTTDETLRAQTVKQWLQRHTGWLLLVDNVDDEAAAKAVDDWLQALDSGQVLITSRIKEWRPEVKAHRLDVLDVEPAADFLLERTEDGRTAKPDDGNLARTLAKELDGLALALEQAGAFINRHNLSFADYLSRWRKADQKTRAWHDPRVMQYPRPLATTWQTSVETLNPQARSLLDVLAWLAPEPIPRFLFDYAYAPEDLPEAFDEDSGFPARVLANITQSRAATPCRQTDGLAQSRHGDADLLPYQSEQEAFDCEAALADLRGVSLLLTAKEADYPNEGKLHRVLALITRERQDQPASQQNLQAALALVNAVAVGNPDDVRYWPVWDAIQEHALAVADFAEDLGIDEPTARLLNQLAVFFMTKAQYQQAEPLYRRSLALNESSEKPDQRIIATCLNNLATLLQATNRLEEAEPLMRRALEIDEASFGKMHSNVACDLNNLAALLQATNRLAEAEPLMRRAMEIDESIHGKDHPNVATDLNNLARLLQDTNRLDEAEHLMRRVLDIDEASFGDTHPKVALRLNNLAQLLKATNRLDEAEPLMRRALEIDEASFGKTHPNIARDINNLALLLTDTNRLDEAEPLMRRALDIDEASLGKTHPKVATRLNNLALLLQATNRMEEAEPLMRRALEIDEASFDNNHPNVACDLNNLARLLQDTERLDEAEPLMRRALLILLNFTRSIGHQHPHLQAAFGNYYELLQAMGKTEAEIQKCLMSLGPEAGFTPEAFAQLFDE